MTPRIRATLIWLVYPLQLPLFCVYLLAYVWGLHRICEGCISIVKWPVDVATTGDLEVKKQVATIFNKDVSRIKNTFNLL